MESYNQSVVLDDPLLQHVTHEAPPQSIEITSNITTGRQPALAPVPTEIETTERIVVVDSAPLETQHAFTNSALKVQSHFETLENYENPHLAEIKQLRDLKSLAPNFK